MTGIEPANYTDGYDALTRMCEGHSSESIAYHLIHDAGLWEGKNLETGATRIRACLNRDKQEFFKLAELIAIMRFTKRYDPLFFACDILGLTRPHAINTNEQLDRLTSVAQNAAGVINQVLEQLSAMGSSVQQAKQQNPPRLFCISREY